MKIFVYSHRKDETEYFKKFSKKYNVEIKLCKYAPTMENAELAKGFQCISIVTTNINDELVEKFHKLGIKYISTRTIGYDHIDIRKAKELGIRVGNVTYSPNSVTDYTIMMMLMSIRKMKAIIERSNVQDYSLKGIMGKDIQSLTVGIVGTGKIGQTVIKHLRGFECKLIAYDLYENESIKEFAEYVSLEKLFKESDIISLHVPATNDNYHLINEESIKLMKNGVFIINTARGCLIDTKALIDSIEQKKIAGAALDVIENESNLYYKDLKYEILDNRELAILKSYPNVIISPHTAFYTEQAVSDMVQNSILSCILLIESKENPWEIL